MAEYYLISQLPSLDGVGESSPLPITEERFLELCGRFLGKKAQNGIKNLTVSPSRSIDASGSELIDKWNRSEQSLRFALGKIRAEKMNKSFDTENKIIPVEHVRAAAAALEMANPMEAEKYLNRYRLGILESLRPTDSFSNDYIYYYGLKLKLLLRIRRFDTEKGEASYRKIYSSILSGEDLEARK